MKKLNSIQKEMLEVLEDTVQFYSKNPSKRGLEHVPGRFPSCSFLTPEGNKCAVGRYLNKKDLTQLGIMGELSNSVQGILEEVDYKFSTKIIKRLPLIFWNDLQALHDPDIYWIKNGISTKGKRAAFSIKNNIINGYYEKVNK